MNVATVDCSYYVVSDSEATSTKSVFDVKVNQDYIEESAKVTVAT